MPCFARIILDFTSKSPCGENDRILPVHKDITIEYDNIRLLKRYIAKILLQALL